MARAYDRRIDAIEARADTATAEKLLATMTPEQMDRGQRIVEQWAGGSDASEHDATT